MLNRLIDDHKEFDPFLRTPSTPSLSSRQLGWEGFVLEGHSVEPGERPEAFSERHIVGLWRERGVGEHTAEHRIYVPYTKTPGMITVAPPGIVPAVRRGNRSAIVLCALESSYVRSIEDEQDERPLAELRYQPGFRDAVLRTLMTLLAEETRQGGFLGRMYADHLMHAITIRLLFLEDVRKSTTQKAASALPRHLLQRVLQRMHDPCADLDLQTLARETGYSRQHFLRMFHAATGYTPHRYVLQLRLKHAQELMRDRRTALIDVAANCGFSSQAHMSRIFRQAFGVTPSEYRRSL